MATSNAYSLPSSESFKLPPEPCPLPSLGSDEESFVVLWKDMDSKSIVEVNHDPIGTGIIEEAKQLINNELTEIDKLSLLNRVEPQIENNLALDGPGTLKIEKSMTQSGQLDESTALPKMPHVEKVFNTPEVISITTLSTELTSEELHKKVLETVEENIRLKDILLQNNMSMKSQYERMVAWQEDVQKVHQAHKDKILEAKEFIEKLTKENYNLLRELEQARAIKETQKEEIYSLRRELREKNEHKEVKLRRSSEDNMKEFELDVANKKVRDLELAMKNLTVENAALVEDNSKLACIGTKSEDYEKEIDRLQTALQASKREAEEAKMELAKIKSTDEEKLKSMNEVIDSLRSQLVFTRQQQNMLPSPEEVTNMRQQLASAQIVLTQVEQARGAAFIQIDSLNKEILELKAKLNGSQAQTDEMYALKAQLDLYKADFEAEKDAKETIKTEKDKLSEDMQNLQRRNQQLQEEIDMLRENDYVVPPSQRREHVSAPSAPAASGASNEHPMKCPVCRFGFNTQAALETHVYRCIELDDHLP